MAAQETFTSRWGLIVAGLGMAVGTGNLWRFPRIAAQNGGAAFLIPWILFLFVWSIPLLIAEFGFGRGARRGVIGSFARLLGERFAWMGGFIAVTTIMILFYYSVVTGWTIKYFLAALTGQLRDVEPGAYWTTFTGSWEPILFHIIAALLGGFIIQRGIVGGVERASKIIIPTLFLILVIAAIRAVTLPGAARGLEFMFNPDLSRLANYRTWLEAATQSAWSTGAGWGLILTYSAYMRRSDDIVLNATTIGFGDNSASLLAGLAILPTAFAILSATGAMTALEAGNQGLLFIWIPQLFARVPGGVVLLPLFFLGVVFAALSSLMAMIELASRILMDTGLPRRRAVPIVTTAVIIGGLPSAVSLTVFDNQDWVWGVALMISGFFIALGVGRFGARRFRSELVNVEGNDVNAPRVLEWILKYLVPVEFVVMFSWWMYQAAAVYDPEGWWNPFHTFSVGTCLLQWGIALAFLLMFNRRLARASLRGQAGGEA